MTTGQEPSKQVLNLALKVNVKWRQWQRASDKVFGSYNDPELIEASAARLKMLVHFEQVNEVWDYGDGESFGIPTDDGTFRFRFTRKGAPHFIELEELLS